MSSVLHHLPVLFLLIPQKYEVGLLRSGLFSYFRVYGWHGHRYSGEKVGEIGEHIDTGESGVSQVSQRISLKIGTDSKLRKKINVVENRLNLLDV
jgi:hypothetical protein